VTAVPTLFAPAKINATLEILSRRDDGYHALRSVMLPIALYDRIDFEPSVTATFATSDPALSRGNLVERALAAAAVESTFDVRLHKAIPVGGGLGGGSSDAAAILLAAMDGRLGPRPDCDWIDVARRLGSDVPFFLCGTAALVEGAGERVTALGALPDWWLLVVRPHAAVATADAYRLLDLARASGDAAARASRPRGTSASLAVVDALQRRDFAAFAGAVQNDFHEVILGAYPPIARAAAALRASGAEHVLLSGSGSCLFAAFEAEDAARESELRLALEDIDAAFCVPLHRDPAWC
jgi:4-diphosphocytidyl-2-C-methyl-D-erythritol kinase